MADGKQQTVVRDEWKAHSFQKVMQLVRTLGIGRPDNRPWSNTTDREVSDSIDGGGIRYQTLNKLSHPLPNPTEADQRRIARNVAGLCNLIRHYEPNAADWITLVKGAQGRLQDEIGVGQADYDFAALLEKFRAASGKPVGLIGATYVDFEISPVTVTNISRDVSYTNLDPPKVRLGGGVVVFGEAYKRLTSSRSILHTVVGPEDAGIGSIQRNLLEKEKERWLDDYIAVPSPGGTPAAFHLHNVDLKSRCVFAHSAPTKGMDKVNAAVALANHKYGLVFTSYPESIPARLPVPVVVSYGYHSPRGGQSDDGDRRKKVLLAGNIDLLFGSFYEFARLWGKTPQDRKKWDRSTRRKLLEECFSTMKRNTVVIVRDFNYGKRPAQLNIFLYVSRRIYDLTPRLPDNSPSDEGFFMDARKFDAALVASLVTSPRVPSFGATQFCNLISQACIAAFPSN